MPHAAPDGPWRPGDKTCASAVPIIGDPSIRTIHAHAPYRSVGFRGGAEYCVEAAGRVLGHDMVSRHMDLNDQKRQDRHEDRVT
ncbi:MAG: hypothetical protein AAF317_09770 [Pseudomonadota bacterium]